MPIDLCREERMVRAMKTIPQGGRAPYGSIALLLLLAAPALARDVGGNDRYSNENYLNRRWLNYGKLREAQPPPVVIVPRPNPYANPQGYPTQPTGPRLRPR